jgi:hypothetical protein
VKPKQIGKLTSTGAGVYLPEDAVTQGFAILARRRSGKSVTAGVMMETFCSRGDPWVCLDPASAHWGIKYRDADGRPGEASGYEVLIVGGKYGDVALDEHMGEALADIVCETDISCVIDLKASTMAARKRFVTGFANRLYAVNETPRHLFLEEAHQFVPQQPRFEEQKEVLGALERLVTGGGGMGIGFTLITQRPALVNKNVLEEIDNLFVMRMSGPNDIAAVKDWFDHNVGDKDRLREILNALPSFRQGEAWLLSPEWLGELKRLQMRLRDTYHAGRTPVRGEKPIAPKPIELGRVIEQFRKAAEQRHIAVQEEKDLRKANAELQREVASLRKKSAPPDQAVIDREVHKAVTQREREIGQELNAAKHRLALAEDQIALAVKRSDLDAGLRLLEQGVERLRRARESVNGTIPNPPAPARKSRLHTSREVVNNAPPIVNASPSIVNKPAPTPSVNGEGEVRLKSGARLMLTELARRHPATWTRAQLATLVRLKRTGGTFGTYLSNLRTAGFIEEQGGQVTITDVGLDAAGVVPDAPTTHEDVMAMWSEKLKAGAYRMLELVVESRELTRDELAEGAGLEAKGGTFGTYLSNLRTNGLVVEADGVVRPADVVFPEGLE